MTHSRFDNERSSNAEMTVGRRTFLQASALGFAGAMLSERLAADEGKKTRVVIVRHDGATDDQGVCHEEIAARMVERALRELSGKPTIAEAWQAFIKPEDVVGIKVNPAGGTVIPTQPGLVRAIAMSLVTAGVKENSILIWDRSSRELTKVGYTLNDSPQGVRCYGTDKGRPAPGKDDARAFYTEAGTPVADKSVLFSRILAEEITALINAPVMKDHIIAGVSGAMKNNYGSILNPRELHRSYCDPYAAALNATDLVRQKTRLVITDALRAMYNGGPQGKPEWTWRQNSIIVGTDPVAVDAVMLRILEDKRKEKGMDPIAHRAKHIATAAKMGLGTNDPAQIDLLDIDLTRDT